MSTANRPTRETIAATALELVDREGLDALSMRRLARALGMGTMTLYGHFRSKEELLDAVVDVVTARHRPPPVEGSWRKQLEVIARTFLDGLHAHPALVQLRFARPIMTPGSLRYTEAGLAALLDAGLDRAEAASAFRVVFLYVFAFAAFSAPELTDALRDRGRAGLAVLPPGEFPAVTAAAAEMAGTLGGADQFEYGLARILDGIERRIRG